MYRDLAHWVRFVLMNPLRKKFAKQYKMKPSSSEHDLVVLALLKKRKRKRKYWVHPILKLRREEGEFHLIKELRDYPESFKVYFWMSVAQFDALLAILAQSVFIFCLFYSALCLSFSATALCCRRRWINLSDGIRDFDVRLYGGSELSKRLSKCVPHMRKTQKIEPDPNFYMTDESFGGSV